MAARKRASESSGQPTLPFGETPQGLDCEIDMLRGVIHRVEDMADDKSSLAEMLRVLDTLSMACTRLGNLLKTEKELSKDVSSRALIAALDKTLEAMQQERPLWK